MRKWGAFLFLGLVLFGCQAKESDDKVSNNPLLTEDRVAYESDQSLIETDGTFVEKDEGVLSTECPVDATVNSAVEALQLFIDENQIGVVIHEPTDGRLLGLDELDVLVYEEAGWDHRFLIVPKEVGTKVTIYSTWYDGNRFVDGAPVFDELVIEQNQVIEVRCLVPEGIPNLKVVMEYKEKRVEYLITYDGRGDREQIEYLEVFGE